MRCSCIHRQSWRRARLTRSRSACASSASAAPLQASRVSTSSPSFPSPTQCCTSSPSSRSASVSSLSSTSGAAANPERLELIRRQRHGARLDRGAVQLLLDVVERAGRLLLERRRAIDHDDLGRLEATQARGARRPPRERRLGSWRLFRTGPVEHRREHLVDDGSHRDAAELPDADEPREPAELQVGAREAVVEDEAQAVGISELAAPCGSRFIAGSTWSGSWRSSRSSRWRSPMRRISARPSMVRSAAEMATAMLPSNGSPCDDCTPVARTWSSRVDLAPSQSTRALPGDASRRGRPSRTGGAR